MSKVQSTITERCQHYWELINPGEVFTAESLFEIVKESGEFTEDIKYVRGFLTRKFNDGVAFLIPNVSPPTYEKLPKQSCVAEYGKKLLDHLPIGEKFTSTSFNNRLPRVLQSQSIVATFLQRAKMCGAIANYVEDGEFVMDNRCKVVIKKKDVDKLPVAGAIPDKYKITAKKEPITMDKADMAKMLSGMKPSEVGMAIFEALNSLLTENENLTEAKNNAVAELATATKTINELKREIKGLKYTLETSPKEETLGQIYQKKHGITKQPGLFSQEGS